MSVTKEAHKIQAQIGRRVSHVTFLSCLIYKICLLIYKGISYCTSRVICLLPSRWMISWMKRTERGREIEIERERGGGGGEERGCEKEREVPKIVIALNFLKS